MRLQQGEDRSGSALAKTSLMAALILLAVMPAIAGAAPLDRKALRDTLKQMWDSLESVAYRCEEQTLDDKGKRRDDLGYSRWDIVLASGGRRARTLTAVRPGGEEIMDRWREDGRRQYGFTPSPGANGKVDRLGISNQENTAENYTGPMCLPMWILTPGGKPLYSYLDGDAKVTPTADSAHPDRITLTVGSAESGFRCELDPDHDWLPAMITIGEDFKIIVVEEFTRDQGRWFPHFGVEATTVLGKTTRVAFRVDELGINRPLPADTFAMPTPIPGAFVIDKTAHKSQFVGGLAAKKKLEKENADRATKTTAPRLNSASREPASSPWPWILGGVAAVVLMSAGALARRGRKSPQ